MIKLDMPIIVEGKYDKIKLSNIFDCVIITTDGFGIFKNKEKEKLIKKLAEKNGVIIMTDSDSAGNIIRNHLKGVLGEDKIHTVLIPEIKGKERRKNAPSKEGLLGVEGVDDEIIISAFKRFLPDFKPKENKTFQPITTAFLMEMGLSGVEGSAKRREFLLNKLNLPLAISPATLKKILGEISSREEIENIMKEY